MDRDLSRCHLKIREFREQRPQKGAATASNVEQALRLESTQNPQHAANTRQIDIPFELVQPQSSLEASFDGSVRLTQPSSHERIRKLGAEALDNRRGKRSTPAQRARDWFVTSYPLLGALAATFELIEDPTICIRLQTSIAAVSDYGKEL